MPEIFRDSMESELDFRRRVLAEAGVPDGFFTRRED
jgi:hypothetical protein